MRNYFMIIALFVASIGFSQEENEDGVESTTYSIGLSGFEIGTAGVSVEFYGSYKGDKYGSIFLQADYNIMTYDNDFVNVDGTGQQFAIGSRTYYGKEKAAKGFYTGNSFVYGRVKFDETIGLFQFKGTYSFVSLFNPEIGYKIMAGRFAIDPFAGVMWKIQIKGKGDIDNKNIDVWMPRVGVKVGFVIN